MGGIITGKKVKTTKRQPDGFCRDRGSIWQHGNNSIPSTLKQYAELLVEESIVIVTGRVSMREEEEAKMCAMKLNHSGLPGGKYF